MAKETFKQDYGSYDKEDDDYIREKSALDSYCEGVEDVLKILENMKQEPKTGHWIDTGSGQKCSECGEIQYGYDNFRHFCANCGTKMDKEYTE